MKAKKTILIILLLALSALIVEARPPILDANLVNYLPMPSQPGQTVDVFFELSNQGDPTTEAWFDVVEEYPFTILKTQDSERAAKLGSLTGTQRLQFRVRIADDARDGIAPLRVRYGSNRNKNVYAEKQFDINVVTFDSRISVDRVQQIPEELVPGETGQVVLTLINLDDRPVKNVDVVLDMTGTYDFNKNMNNMISMQAMINARLEEVNMQISSGKSPLGMSSQKSTGMSDSEKSVSSVNAMSFKGIAPAGTPTQKRIHSLGPGQIVQVTFDVQAMPDAMPNVYVLPVFVSYNDEDNNPFNTFTEVPVTVNMQPDVLVELKGSTLRSEDVAGDVTVVVANRGLSELRYVSLEVTETEDFKLLTAPSKVYLGTLKPGESGEGTFKVLAKSDELNLPTTVSFRDSFNKKFTKDKELDLAIINKNYYRDVSFEMMFAWIVLGLVVFAVTIYYVRNLSREARS
ncbi:hypothetical protein COV18_00795 [Candidatus Woesearchaeota archaeon CG10_big_fil_rev_8_21_14_0_10_37_12]|nr:MAG: hypothetical protein COV18_00795 [Candidatus Woesearchaeota archaeon CG10_big_fil_rev_8_21_14_0_10_37_12]